MQKLLLYISFLLLLFSSFQVKADHAGGGEIEYECIGPRTWKIRLTLYRECIGAPLCFNGNCQQTMIAKPNTALNPQGCSASPNSVNFNLLLVKVEDVGKASVELCGNIAKNGCDNRGQVIPGTYNPSIEKYVFEGTLDLSNASLNNSNCEYWDVYYEICCRQASVWNLAVSLGQDTKIAATINIFNRTSNLLKNNSPILKNEPVLVSCSGVEQIFNMGALDPDGDSLSYEIVSSLKGSGVSVNYQYPGSSIYPFPLNGSKSPHTSFPQPNGPYVIIDAVNGDVSFNPSNNTPSYIFGNMNIRINQWSYDSVGNPILVGRTSRDFQYYTLNCTNNTPPKFSTSPSLANNQPRYNYTVDAGQQLCFTVTAKDTDFNPSISRSDTTFISWNQGIIRPGKLTFVPTYPVGPGLSRPREDQWQFCWQTESSDLRRLPYYFMVTARDKVCPNVGQVTRAFSVQVMPAPTFNIKKSNLNCGIFTYKIHKEAPYAILNTASLQITTTPSDTNFSNGVRTIIPISINPSTMQSDTINQPRLMFTDSFKYTQPGKFYIRFNYTTPTLNTLATIIDSIELHPSAILSSTIIANSDIMFCSGDSVTLSSTVNSSQYKYQWQKNNVNFTNAMQYDLIVKTSGTYRLLLTEKTFNCSALSNEINIQLHPQPVPSITLSANSICFENNTLVYKDNSTISSGGFIRLWDFGDSTTSTAKTGTKTFDNIGTYQVKLLLTSNMNCMDSISSFVNIVKQPIANISANSTTIFCDGKSVELSSYDSVNAYYYWYKNGQLISNASTNKFNANQQGLYKLIIADSTGCKDTSNVINVQVNPKPIANFNINKTKQCLNGNQFLLTDSSIISNGNYTNIWNWNNDSSSQTNLNLSFQNAGVYPVQLKVTSTKYCSDSIIKNLTVSGHPSIGNITGLTNGLSTQQKYNYKVNQQLNHTYHWAISNGNIITGQGTDSILVQWQSPGIGQLKATITNANVCDDTTSTTVNIINNPPFIIDFNPKNGTKGTTVTIKGGNFNGTSVVTFGDVNAKSFTVVSPSEISAIVDTGATGNVGVITSGGAALLSLFTYNQKKIITEIGANWYSIFPNPAFAEISIESNQSLIDTDFELFDTNGKIVYTYTCKLPTKRIDLDIKHLGPSMYLLRIKSNGQSNTVKIIKH